MIDCARSACLPATRDSRSSCRPSRSGRLAPVVRRISLLAALIVAFHTAQAQRSGPQSSSGLRIAPDFSGTWVLDRGRSAGDVLPASMSFRVVQDSSKVLIQRTTSYAGGSDVTTLRFRLDGTPTVETIE